MVGSFLGQIGRILLHAALLMALQAQAAQVAWLLSLFSCNVRLTVNNSNSLCQWQAMMAVEAPRILRRHLSHCYVTLSAQPLQLVVGWSQLLINSS